MKLVQNYLKQKNDLSENLLLLANNYPTQLLKNEISIESLNNLNNLLAKLQKRCKHQRAYKYVGMLANLLSEINLRTGNTAEALKIAQLAASYYFKNKFFENTSDCKKYRKIYLSNKMYEIKCLCIIKDHNFNVKGIIDSTEEFCKKWLPAENWFFEWAKEMKQGLIKKSNTNKRKLQNISDKLMLQKKDNTSDHKIRPISQGIKNKSNSSFKQSKPNILEKYFSYKHKQAFSSGLPFHSFKLDHDKVKKDRSKEIYNYLLQKYGNSVNYQLDKFQKNESKKKENFGASTDAIKPLNANKTLEGESTIGLKKKSIDKELVDILKSFISRDKNTLKELVESTQQLKELTFKMQKVPWIDTAYSINKNQAPVVNSPRENKNSIKEINDDRKVLIDEGVQMTQEEIMEKEDTNRSNSNFKILVNNKRVNDRSDNNAEPPAKINPNKKVEFSDKVEDIEKSFNNKLNKISTETRKSEINRSAFLKLNNDNLELSNQIPTANNITKLEDNKKPIVEFFPLSETSDDDDDDDLSIDFKDKGKDNNKYDLNNDEARNANPKYNKSIVRTNIFDILDEKANKHDYDIECESSRLIWTEDQLLKIDIINKLISADRLIINLYSQGKLVKSKTINCEGLKFIFKKINYTNYIPFYHRISDAKQISNVITTVLFQLINIKIVEETIKDEIHYRRNPIPELPMRRGRTINDLNNHPNRSKISTFNNLMQNTKNLTDIYKKNEQVVRTYYRIDLNPIPVSLLPDTEIDLFGKKYLFSFVHLKGLLFRIYLHSLKTDKSIETCKKIDVSFNNQDFLTYFEVNKEEKSTSMDLITIKSGRSVHLVEETRDDFSKKLINILHSVYKKCDKSIYYQQLYVYLKIDYLRHSKYHFFGTHLKSNDKGFVIICAAYDVEDGKVNSINSRYTLGRFVEILSWT